MFRMPHVAIDPYLLCLPSPCHSVAQLDHFVGGLLSWSESLRKGDIKILVSDSCKAALVDEGRYPYQHQLRSLLRTFQVEFADHETICKVAQSLLDHSPSLEETCGIGGILFDQDKTTVQPEFFVTRLGPRTASALKESLVTLGCWQGFRGADPEGCVIASKGEPDCQEDCGDMLVLAEVLEIEGPCIAGSVQPVFPLRLSESFQVFYSHEAILKQLGSLHLWGRAESEEAAKDAIDVRVRELLDAGAGEAGEVVRYTLGRSFLISARRWGFGSRGDWATNLINSCARILIGRPRNPIRAFRSDDRPTVVQLSREDGAIAYRTHLTKHGAGFRLMFWRCTDGSVEFANVGDKDELEIF